MDSLLSLASSFPKGRANTTMPSERFTPSSIVENLLPEQLYGQQDNPRGALSYPHLRQGSSRPKG